MFEESKYKLWTTIVRDALLLLRRPNPGPHLFQTHKVGPDVSCPAVVSSLLMGGYLGLYLTNSLSEKCLDAPASGARAQWRSALGATVAPPLSRLREKRLH